MVNKKQTTIGDLRTDTHLNFRIIICAPLAAFVKELILKPSSLPSLLFCQFKLSDTSRPNPEVLPPQNAQ